MKPDSDNFEGLQRLLALKRYEQPPPGYFNRFADQVMQRIDSGEELGITSWWQRFAAGFALRPALAGAFGLAVAGIYYFGLGVSQLVDQQTAQTAPSAIELWPAEPIVSPLSLAAETSQPSALRRQEPLMASSMQPVISAGAPRGLFAPGAGLRGASLQPASFSLRGY